MIKEKQRQVQLANEYPSKCFYVYLHRRLTTSEPFYVGKGKRYRAWRCEGRSGMWNNISNKHGFNVELIKDGLSEQEAFALEVQTIGELKRSGHLLCNHTNGGEGLSGFKWSEEQMRNHPSKGNIGRKQSPEEIKKRVDQLRGRNRTESTKEKLRISNIPRAVFSDICKTLTGSPLLSYKKLGELSGVEPASLCKTKYYMRVPEEAIKRSADKRRGKPTWNAGRLSPETSGVDNNFADKNVYTFVRVEDGRRFTGTRYELCDKYSITRSQVGKLFTNKPRKSSMGWAILKETDGS